MGNCSCQLCRFDISLIKKIDKMIGSNPTIEKLSAEVGKKTRQIDMLESSIGRLTSELEASKKTIQEIRKVRQWVLN